MPLYSTFNTYIAMCKACIQIMLQLLESQKTNLGIYRSGSLARVFDRLLLAIHFKYKARMSGRDGVPLWKDAMTALLSIANTCIPVMQMCIKGEYELI